MLKLACATLSVEGFGETDYRKTFQVLPQIGFRNVELNMWHPQAFTRPVRDFIKRKCSELDIEAAAIHLSGGFGKEPVRDYCHKMVAMQTAAELGVKLIVSSGYDKGQTAGISEVIASLKRILPLAEDMGISISLENHCNNDLAVYADYAAIFDSIDSPNLGICIDTGHFEAAGQDLDEIIDGFAAKINHIHLKENKGMGTKQFTRFGEGTTDNCHVIERMTELGYSGFMTVELSPEIGSDRPFSLDDLVYPYKLFKKYETDY